MATMLTETGEMTVAATERAVAVGRRCRTRHRLDAEAGGHVPGRALRAAAGRAAVRATTVNMAAFWRLLGRPVVRDEAGETWVLGAGADERKPRSPGWWRRTSRCPISRAAAHAVGTAGEEGVPGHLGLLVRLSF